ncbi:RtcB family protein [Burkholderia diffusa]|uniref:RtcB family protein n=1 Tax=Burkholderia diffusa TaxID=488732 RepID=UPI001E5D654B|nr:RtcB family protein [Burkholderia diffusa]
MPQGLRESGQPELIGGSMVTASHVLAGTHWGDTERAFGSRLPRRGARDEPDTNDPALARPRTCRCCRVCRSRPEGCTACADRLHQGLGAVSVLWREYLLSVARRRRH